MRTYCIFYNYKTEGNNSLGVARLFLSFKRELSVEIIKRIENRISEINNYEGVVLTNFIELVYDDDVTKFKEWVLI